MSNRYYHRDVDTQATVISRVPFLVLTSLAFAVILLPSATRCAIRLRHGNSLRLDDYVFGIAISCLVTGIALVFAVSHDIYAVAGSRLHHSLSPVSEDATSAMVKVTTYITATQCLLWMTTFIMKVASIVCLKESFGTSSQSQRKSYCAALVAIVVCWVYITCVPFATCPHTGIRVLRCWDGNKHILSIMGTALDCVSWIIVLSFLLMHYRLTDSGSGKKRDTAALYSGGLIIIGMIAVAIVGSAVPSSHRGPTPYAPLYIFLTQLEACLAVTLNCIFTILIPPNKNSFCTPHNQYFMWTPEDDNLASESEEQLRKGMSLPPLGGTLHTTITGGLPTAPGSPCALSRAGSVLRTREVTVAVEYEDTKNGPRSPKACWMTYDAEMRSLSPNSSWAKEIM